MYTIGFLKALHIVGFVAWFAGLFYLVRLFVYHVEANEKPARERELLQKQFTIMAWRLYRIITTPAMLITLLAGFGMWFVHTPYLEQGWMHLKVTLVFGLVFYHHYCKRMLKQLEAGSSALSAYQFRLLNEVPTLFLVSIVFLAVFKNMMNFVYGIAGLIALAVALIAATRFYKYLRDKN